jgi:hypothetical protein
MTYCPHYGLLYCDCETPECPNMLTCDDIYSSSDVIFDAYNSYEDHVVNMIDFLDADFYEFYLLGCDANFDGSMNRCELFDCLLEAENHRRN